MMAIRFRIPLYTMVISAFCLVAGSTRATAQLRWLAYHEKSGDEALFRRVQWDSVAAVIFDATNVAASAGTQNAQIFTSDRGVLRLLGTVLMNERTYSDLRRLISAQNTRWLPALATINGSPYTDLKAYVDVDRAAHIVVRSARDANSKIHENAYVIVFEGRGSAHPQFAIVEANRNKVTARIDASVKQ